jgi:hypothetical protein
MLGPTEPELERSKEGAISLEDRVASLGILGAFLRE